MPLIPYISPYSFPSSSPTLYSSSLKYIPSFNHIILTFFFLLMEKFLNYKSKIINSKRDSQKIQDDDLFQMVRQYQQLKTIKKYGKYKGQLESVGFDCRQSPVSKEPLVEGSQIDTPNRSCDSSPYQNDQISMGKQQSTMSSLIGSESNDSTASIQQAKLPYISCSCLRHHNTYRNSSYNCIKNIKQSSQHIKPLQESLKTREEMQSAKQDLLIIPNAHCQFLTFYEQSQHKQNYYLTKNTNHLSPFNTSRQPLQLSQLHLSKSKNRERSLLFDDQQPIITQEENQKIEMLFREEYKDIFLSSISNIQFNQFASSNNSLKQELYGSSQLFVNDSPEVSKFQTILDIINQKDSKNRQNIEKHGGNQQLTKRRQKVIILNPKQSATKNGEIIKNIKTAKPMPKEKKPSSRK